MRRRIWTRRLCVIDIRGKAAADADALLTLDDVRRWVARYGDIPAGACAALHSGWSRYADSPHFRNAAANGTMHFPGFHAESADFPVHNEWLPRGRRGLESVANPDKLPPRGATIIVGAPKHKNGTGGPARVLALAGG